MNSLAEIPDLRWVLRHSAIAYFLIVLWQSAGVVYNGLKFPPVYAGIHLELHPVTAFILRYPWLGCSVVAIVSLMSTCFLILKPTAPAAHLRFSYLVSLTAFVTAFAWAGFALKALYAR